MDNKFIEVMSNRSNEELLAVLRKKNDYQPEAVEAAEEELKKRDFDSEQVSDLSQDGAIDFVHQIKSYPDSQLLKIYQDKYADYTKIDFSFLLDELKKRKIEPELWYYTNGEQKHGPYTVDNFKELAKQDKFNRYDYVWRKGLSNWTVAENVDGLFDKDDNAPPAIQKQKPTWITDNQAKKEKTTGVIMSAIIIFLTVPLWFFIALIQAGVAVAGEGDGLGLLAIYNILITLGSIAIGVGILKLRKWGYNWGLGSALLNTLWFGLQFNETGSLFFAFLISLEIMIVVLLFSNRRHFDTETIVKENAYI
jgi:hypothetical protein